MPRSEWICNSCEESFKTKGKRDGHRERVHREKVLIDIEKKGMKRSENGKFICECRRGYTSAQSLQRHQKNCNKKFGSNEVIDDGIGRGI